MLATKELVKMFIQTLKVSKILTNTYITFKMINNGFQQLGKSSVTMVDSVNGETT